MPPGADLAALLGRLAATGDGLNTLEDDELISVMIGWRRLTSWAQAAELEAVSELEARRQARYTRDGVACSTEVCAGVGSEISLALTLTEHSAAVLQGLAYSLSHQLPGTAALLKSAAIDLPRARVIVTGLTGLSQTAMRAVEAAVLPHAPAMTTGRLRALVAAKIAELAPEEVVAKAKAAQKDRRVEVREDSQGTATLLGLNLPLVATVAAANRVTALAKAFKNNGDPRTMDQLRADVLLMCMLGLIPARTTPGGPVVPGDPPNPPDPAVPHRASAPKPPPPHPAASKNAPKPGLEHAARTPRGAEPTTGVPPVHGRMAAAAPWPQAPSPEQPPDAAYADAAPGHAHPDVPDPGIPDRDMADPDAAYTGMSGFDTADPGAADSGAAESHAAQSDMANDMADTGGPGCPATVGVDQTEAPRGDHDAQDDPGDGGGEEDIWDQESWDEGEGAPVPEWLTRAATQQLGGPHLVVNLATLMNLTQTPARLGPYAPLAAPIARQILDRQLTAGANTGIKMCWTVTDSDGTALHHGQMRYRPTEEMRRLVQARDQTCRFPTCRRPAIACDLDHTRPYDEGGPTCPCNLAALCRRHHRLKQTEGWKLTQTAPGVLAWETPTGRTHTVGPDPYPT